MQKNSTTCSHPDQKQVATTHGTFCLDCGMLTSTHKKTVQKVRLRLSTTPALKPAQAAPRPVAIAHTFKISVADISRKRRITTNK